MALPCHSSLQQLHFLSFLLKQAKDRGVLLPYFPSPAMWLSCKKPVECCTWSRTVNIPFIMEGMICCKGQRKQQPQGKKCSFSLPHCCCLLQMFSQANFTLWPLPLFLISVQLLWIFFLLCWYIRVLSFPTKQAGRINRVLSLKPQSVELTH